MGLTKKQKSLVRELDEVFHLVMLDYWNISRFRKRLRTDVLEVAKRFVVRGEVVSQYTLIDEHLSNVLCNHYFGWGRSHIKLWKGKKFRNFNQFVLQEMPLRKKLEFVRAVSNIPNQIANQIERVNNLRNGMAHAFFPENLRKRRDTYKGVSIFTANGLKMFLDDTAQVHKYFKRASRPEWS
jgi:hypothetical protein